MIYTIQAGPTYQTSDLRGCFVRDFESGPHQRGLRNLKAIRRACDLNKEFHSTRRGASRADMNPYQIIRNSHARVVHGFHVYTRKLVDGWIYVVYKGVCVFPYRGAA